MKQITLFLLFLQVKNNSPSFTEVCKILTNDLKRRFDYMVYETVNEFDCIYVLSTCLDQNYRMFVNRQSEFQNLTCKQDTLK